MTDSATIPPPSGHEPPTVDSRRPVLMQAGTVIALDPAVVRNVGAAAAIVLGYLRNNSAGEWWTSGQPQMSADLGLRRSQIATATTRLAAAGLIEKGQRHNNSRLDRTLSYRTLDE